MFSRGCGTRSRALTRGLGKRLLTPSPDAGRGKVAKDAKLRLRPRLWSGQVGVDAGQVRSFSSLRKSDDPFGALQDL
jgi:phage tail tape-measure protein